LVVVLILPPVDLKEARVVLVGDSVFYFRTKHHLVALHEIKHHVFESWHKSFWVNQIEVNILLSSDLDPFVAFDEINESSVLNCVVISPRLLTGELISFEFEEQNFA
tara:strand:+ start:39 stop:359 length:321 start_codon:yes stop_codon:yes gene_type:complete